MEHKLLLNALVYLAAAVIAVPVARRLGLGAVLTVTSAPLRTSPVKRGDWVLRRVLGTAVPPPPADAGSIPADDVLGDGKTVRARLEAHRPNPSLRENGFSFSHLKTKVVHPVERFRTRFC